MVARGLAESRTKAQALVMAGRVSVDGQAALKPGQTVPRFAEIRLIEGPRYVSRGGEKLEGALEDLKVDPAGRACLDVGASTGGFTDCLLQRGAATVVAIDVGTHQLHDSLRSDPRVTSREQTHILDVAPDSITPAPTLATIDVSFISLKKVLPRVRELVAPNADILALLKPQFEVGAKFLRKGVVKSDEVRRACVDDMGRWCVQNGFAHKGTAVSHLLGPKGNQEFFLHLVASR